MHALCLVVKNAKKIVIYRGKCTRIWDCGASKVLLWTLTLSSGAPTYPKVSLLQCSGFIPAVRQWKPKKKHFPFLLLSPFHPARLRALHPTPRALKALFEPEKRRLPDFGV